MRTSIVALLVALCCFGCATKEVAPDESKIELAKRAVTENCLARSDYQLDILSNEAVEIRHKTAKARVSYSKANPAGILMTALGDNRIDELGKMRECAAPYMKTLLEELPKAESTPQAK